MVGVVDVGGGSAQIVTGTRRDGPTWSRSIDLGSQRLTSRLLFADPPGRDAIEGGRAEVDRCLDALSPPEAHTWYAVGGSARALRRIAGPRLGTAELAAALTMLAKTPGAEVGRIYGIDEDRARTLTGGAVIVAAVQARLGASLEVVRGGLRDGAVREIAAQIRR